MQALFAYPGRGRKGGGCRTASSWEVRTCTSFVTERKRHHGHLIVMGDRCDDDTIFFQYGVEKLGVLSQLGSCNVMLKMESDLASPLAFSVRDITGFDWSYDHELTKFANIINTTNPSASREL